MNEAIARAADFESRKVYQSKERPSYTAWVSFFKGERGQWYLTCEEVTRPEKPLPKCTREQWFSASLPSGYDKSQYLMEAVILESTDDMRTWNVISREPYHYQHTAGTYGNQMRTRDGRFLRFLHAHYSLDPDTKPSEIFYESDDNGKTWKKMPDFVHPDHFHYYPHRMRMLRDGTLVLCVPHWPKSEAGTERPISASSMRDLDVINERPMMVFFSHDQGRAWSPPMEIYCGQSVSETDFVELPSGDLLFINSSIFANPGRQFVYRNGERFTPGPFEKVKYIGSDGYVPETVCLTEEGIMIGCLRSCEYMWSDDLGQSWWRIQGIPVLEGGMDNPRRMECYQPSIEYLGGGRVACAGHYGGDDAIGERDQYLNIHFFRLEVLTKPTRESRLLVDRDFDESENRWLNSYTVSLTCEGDPLAEKELSFWYVERFTPGFDQLGKFPLEERMEMGEKLLKTSTDSDGKAHVSLPEMDCVTDPHHSYQFVIWFNKDRSDPDFRPAQTPQFEFYALSRPDPHLSS